MSSTHANVTPHMRKAYEVSLTKLPYNEAAQKLGITRGIYARLLNRCRHAGLSVPDHRTEAIKHPERPVRSKVSKLDRMYPPGVKFERCECGLMLPCFCKENDVEFRDVLNSRPLGNLPEDELKWKDLRELDAGIKRYREKHGLDAKQAKKGIGNAIY